MLFALAVMLSYPTLLSDPLLFNFQVGAVLLDRGLMERESEFGILRPALFQAATLESLRCNRILARMPKASYQSLLPHLRFLELESAEVLHRSRMPDRYVYFPITAAASFLQVMENGAAIEIGTVGNEGLIGVSAALGTPASHHQVVVQVGGPALRIESAVLQQESDRSNELRRLLTTYQAAFYTQVSQLVACNGLHPVGKRCCRWLLMTHDRVGSDLVPLTHEYLGYMLGVRRATVTEVLGPLRDQGLISYMRGAITILDRKGLEAAACECYRAVNDEYNRLFG